MSQESIFNEKENEVFGQVATIWENLRGAVLTKSTFKPTDTLSEWLQILTGCFMYINTRYQEAHVARSNNEMSAYMGLKNDAEASGGKFVNASAEKEAKSTVSEMKQKEQILESYKDSAEQGILTLKKLIDLHSLEMQREARQ